MSEQTQADELLEAEGLSDDEVRALHRARHGYLPNHIVRLLVDRDAERMQRN